MKFVFSPINHKTRYLYFVGLPMLFLTWLDQWLEFYLLPNKLRLQIFILAIIFMAIAAAINLSIFIIKLYLAPDIQGNKNNQPDDH